MIGFEFTPDQNAAIESKSNMVITACPGSGKTSVIVEKIRREVVGLQGYKGVIGITFTVKASKELKQRCKQGGLETKSSFFGTIDHFCLSELIFPFISRLYGKSDYTVECKSYNDLNENQKIGLPPLDEIGNEFNTDDYMTYEDKFKLLHENGIILLESIGVLAVRIVTNSLACRNYISSKYTSLYIDEYQDSSQPQHELFLSILDLGLKAVAVGDVNQSIYAWRGSDPQYIQSLITKPEVFEHHIVNVNHRCHPSIVNYANRIFDSNCLLLPTSDIRVYQWVLNGTQHDVAESLTESINKLLADKIVQSLSNIAILVRNNNSLSLLETKLGVPNRIFGENPLSLINTSKTKLMSSLLAYYLDHKVLINDVVEVVEHYSSFSPSSLKDLRASIKSISGRDSSTIKNAILELTHKILDEKVIEIEVNALERVLADKNILKQYMPENKNEVQIMTLHKSKGLEFDIVFHLDLYDWIMPRREFIRDCYDEVFSSWEQDLNLHFVGITRAKEYCILVNSTNRFNHEGDIKQGKKSQFMMLDGLTGLYR
jgi:DNA helicase-2/ATP-dependent DNA helicase PcrA